MQRERASTVRVPRVTKKAAKPVVASQYGPVRPPKARVAKPRVVQPPKGKGPLAPKPSGVFAGPALKNTRLQREVQKGIGKVHIQTEREKIRELASKPIPNNQTEGLNVGKHTKGVGKILYNATQDAGSIAANAIPGAAHVGGQVGGILKAEFTGHPKVAASKAGKLAKEQAQPYGTLIAHPLKTGKAHPLSSLLMLAGAEGAIGRTAGKLGRALPDEAAKGVAGKVGAKPAVKAIKNAVSQEGRTAATVPGTALRTDRRYSPNPIHKGVQVVKDTREVKQAVKTGTVPKSHVISEKDIQKRVDQSHAAGNVAAHREAGAAQKAAVNAVGKDATAATVLRARGITHDLPSLKRYLETIKVEAQHLTGEEKAQNLRTQAEVEHAIKHFDEAKVAASAKAFQDFSHGQEKQVLDLGLIKPDKAEATRLVGHAVHNMGAQVGDEAVRVVKDQSAKTAKKAESAANKAKRTKQTARVNLEKALADARVSVARTGGVAPREHDNLLRAIAAKDAAKAGVKQTRKVAAKAKVANRTVLEQVRAGARVGSDGKLLTTPDIRKSIGANEPAFVSDVAGKRLPKAVSTQKPSIASDVATTGAAIKRGTIETNPRVLVESALNRQRTITAAKNYRANAAEFAIQDEVKGGPARFGTELAAGQVAKEMTAKHGLKYDTMQHPDNGFMVVPHAVKARLQQHDQHVRVPSAIQTVSKNWRTNVLAFSPKWLVGNPTEAAFRSAISGAGPRSFATAQQVLRAANPEDAQALLDRAASGGHYDVAKRQMDHKRAVEDMTGLSKAAYNLARKPVVRHLVDANNAWTKLVMHDVNGRVEHWFQVAQLGKAIRDNPTLMPPGLMKTSDQAVAMAAKGIHDVNIQAELANKVKTAYGQYDGFSPGLKYQIANITPFFAWTRNALTFLYKTMPRDHPALTGAIASWDQSTADWRKDHAIPSLVKTLADSTPYGLIDNPGNNPVKQIQSLVLPQFSEILQNAAGNDWKGAKLTNGTDPVSAQRSIIAAVSSFLVSQVPAASQAARLAGVRTPQMADSDSVEPSLKARLNKVVNPLAGRAKNRTDTPAVLKPLPKVRPRSDGSVQVPTVDVPTIDVPTVNVP